MGVVILGMHRGGTSALTGALHHLGLAVGPDDALIGPTAANVAGHWELAALSDLDEEVLLELGGRWSGPPPVDAEAQRELAEGPWGERAAALMRELLPASGWVWKDPRSCLLLPFWRAVLGDEDLVVVATVRHPGEVARSLERRNDLPVWYGLALWERHLRRAMLDSAGLPVYVVPDDELVRDPQPVLAGLAGFLADRGQPVDLAGMEAAVAFLDPGARHHADVPDLVDEPGATAAQVALLAQLRARTGDQTGRWGDEVGEGDPVLQLWFSEHHRLLRYHDLSEQLRAGLVEVQARKDAERDELQHRKDGEIAELRAHMATLDTWLLDSREDAARAWAEVRRLEEDLADALEARNALVEALEAVIEERDGWKWEVLQHRRRPTARARRAARRLLTGDEG